MHDHCWHLGCILPRVPAIIVRQVVGLRQGENNVSVCLVGSGVGRATLEEVRLEVVHKQGGAARL